MNPLVLALQGAARHRQSGPPLVYKTDITAGDFHIATLNGEAMFFHDSINFAFYAGTDAGSTPYRLVFTDSDGKVAEAWGGAVGGGETLGSELVANGDFSTGDLTNWIDVNSFWSVSDGKAVHSSSSVFNMLLTDGFKDVNQHGLCKLSVDISNFSGDGMRIQGRLSNQTLTFDNIASDYISKYPKISTNGSYSFYYTKKNADAYYLTFARDVSGFASAFSIDNIELQNLSDIPATGLHLMSEEDGTTRNMASVETGFNPNAVANVKIYG